MKEIIKVSNLTKEYNNRVILDDLSFSLNAGESLGILGSNGAGKTTLLETIEGLRKIDKGRIVVLDEDMSKNYKSVQNKIGIQLQKTSLFGDLSVKDNIILYATLYNKDIDLNIELDEFELLMQKNIPVKNLSGGQFQRLNLCIAMLNEPSILFLDEPTTGLDPKARVTLWNKIKMLKDKGTSIILTTHYMEEAQLLCDRIIIIHEGKFVANDSPYNLIKNLNYPKIIIIETDNINCIQWFQEYDYKIFNNLIHFKSIKPETELREILKIVEENNISIQNISIHEANLEDVYMEITKVKLHA